MFELCHPGVLKFKAGEIHGPHFLSIFGVVMQKFESNASIGEFTMAVIKKFINGSGINDFFKSFGSEISLKWVLSLTSMLGWFRIF